MCWTSTLSRVQLFATPWPIALPDFSVHGIFPGKSTEVGFHFISFSGESSQPMDQTLVSCICCFVATGEALGQSVLSTSSKVTTDNLKCSRKFILSCIPILFLISNLLYIFLLNSEYCLLLSSLFFQVNFDSPLSPLLPF